jgi:hypothetical protein
MRGIINIKPLAVGSQSVSLAETIQMKCAYCGEEGNHPVINTSFPIAYSDKLTITYRCHHCKAKTTLSYGLEGIHWEIDHYDEMVYKKRVKELTA